jgi:competence protein ComEA
MNPAQQPETTGHAQRQTVLVLTGLAVVLLLIRGYGTPYATHPTEQVRPVRAINVNEASRVDLLQIPGLGPALADAILQHREQRGPFASVEALDEVPGIGEKTRSKLGNWLAVSSPVVVRGQQPDELQKLERKAPSPPTSPSRKLADGERIAIHTATSEELQKLPGIGPKLADRILEARQREPFKVLEDLRRVSGIGPKTLEKLRPHLSFE